jgi:hypothetical protein
MISITSISRILQRLCFIEDAATYLTGTCGIDSLEEIAYLDDVEKVDTMIKCVTSPGETVKIPVSIRAVVNSKLCVYYLKHMERVQRKPVVNTIKLALVHSYRDQQRHKVSFKKNSE